VMATSTAVAGETACPCAMNTIDAEQRSAASVARRASDRIVGKGEAFRMSLS
jgi:GTP cyclohydrolase FolE2